MVGRKFKELIRLSARSGCRGLLARLAAPSGARGFRARPKNKTPDPRGSDSRASGARLGAADFAGERVLKRTRPPCMQHGLTRSGARLGAADFAGERASSRTRLPTEQHGLTCLGGPIGGSGFRATTRFEKDPSSKARSTAQLGLERLGGLIWDRGPVLHSAVNRAARARGAPNSKPVSSVPTSRRNVPRCVFLELSIPPKGLFLSCGSFYQGGSTHRFRFLIPPSPPPPPPPPPIAVLARECSRR